MKVGFIIVFLLSALSIAAQSPEAMQIFNKGAAFAGNGDFRASLVAYGEALSIARSEGAPLRFIAKIHYNLGVSHFQMGKAGLAAADFREALRLDRSYRKAAYALGMAEALNGDLETAEGAFKAALKLNRRDGEAWFDLGEVYIRSGKEALALEAFQKSVKFGSIDAASGHNNIGVILAARRDFDGAEKEFESAVRISAGGLAEAKSNLGLCHKMQASYSMLQATAFILTKRGEVG